MKKALSIILSLVMLLSVSVASVNAFAVVGSIETTTKKNAINTQVNGKNSADVTYQEDPSNPRIITFTYDGDGELLGWEFPGVTENVHYTVISEEGKAITIRVADDYDGEITANAIVRLDDEEEEEETETKKNESKTSPKTGAGLAGVAAMGAGAAILAALKKKEDEE